MAVIAGTRYALSFVVNLRILFVLTVLSQVYYTQRVDTKGSPQLRFSNIPVNNVEPGLGHYSRKVGHGSSVCLRFA